MLLRIDQMSHFLWRFIRNMLCLVPLTKRLLFPPRELSASFGPSNPTYAWSVFVGHSERLKQSGYEVASRILEVGPGQNIGTSLLWYAFEEAKENSPHIVLWDVFSNAKGGSEVWRECACSLLDLIPTDPEIDGKAIAVLQAVAGGHLIPNIDYRVCPYSTLVDLYRGQPFDLVYSQASLEHAWEIRETWDALRSVTAPDGWHSHRIDLADHGRRETNFIEMLEWPEWAYQLTMQFVPGAINRWRVSQHTDYLRNMGFAIINEERHIQPQLPVERRRLAEPFRSMDDHDLRTTAVDIIARLLA